MCYRPWDIDLLINRTLVYTMLTVRIVAFYILVIVGFGMLFQAHGNLGIALLATGLVAVLFQPLRTRLQRAVNHACEHHPSNSTSMSRNGSLSATCKPR